MLHIYTGDGKGKTTAAIGLAVRAAGRGKRIYFAQFMKGGDTGELHVLQNLPHVTILRSEKDYGFFSSMSPEDKKEMTDVHNTILDALLAAASEGTCDMIVLDEVTYPVNWNLLDREKLDRLLALKGIRKAGEMSAYMDHWPELVLTGRDPADFLLKAADYVTEMRCVRHPYDKGIQAREGIEY